MLIYIFVIRLSVLPTGRMGPVAGEGDPLMLAWYLVLTAITTAAIPVALIVRSTRAAVLSGLREDFVVVARAKRLWERAVLLRHVLRVVAPRILYVVGLQFAYLIGGTVVFSEVVFPLPGIGLQLFNAVTSRNVPMIQSMVFCWPRSSLSSRP